MQLFYHIEEIVQMWTPEAVFLRLTIAVIIGVVIGLDRELKNRGAGIKTHALVCLGAAIIMVVSEYIFHTFPTANADMNRLSAQVVSGIGFLGVGTIIVTGKNVVRGLTTAAGLWTCACAGLSIGIGYLWLALLALFFAIFIYTVLNLLESKIQRFSRYFTLYLELESAANLHAIFAKLRKENMRYHQLEIADSSWQKGTVWVTLSVELDNYKQRPMLIEFLQQAEGVQYYEGI